MTYNSNDNFVIFRNVRKSEKQLEVNQTYLSNVNKLARKIKLARRVKSCTANKSYIHILFG